MAHFRGYIAGSRGVTSRLGTKKTGLTACAQSWDGQIKVHLWHDDDLGKDRFEVALEHHGGGLVKTLAEGIVEVAS